MPLVPNFLELAYKFWPQPLITYLLFSKIGNGSGETVRMCFLARLFAARICGYYQTFLSWPIIDFAEPSSPSRLFSGIFKSFCESAQMYSLV